MVLQHTVLDSNIPCDLTLLVFASAIFFSWRFCKSMSCSKVKNYFVSQNQPIFCNYSAWLRKNNHLAWVVLESPRNDHLHNCPFKHFGINGLVNKLPTYLLSLSLHINGNPNLKRIILARGSSACWFQAYANGTRQKRVEKVVFLTNRVG